MDSEVYVLEDIDSYVEVGPKNEYVTDKVYNFGILYNDWALSYVGQYR